MRVVYSIVVGGVRMQFGSNREFLQVLKKITALPVKIQVVDPDERDGVFCRVMP